MEPFRDQTINYVKAFKEAGVPTKFKLFEGPYQGINNLSAETEIDRAGDKVQFDAFEAYYNRYVPVPTLNTVSAEMEKPEIE